MADLSPENACHRKIAFNDRRRARRIARGMNRRHRLAGAARVGAYACEHCGNYHVGHHRGGTVRAEKAERRKSNP